MKDHQFTPTDIARICSCNPGEFINEFMDYRYGKIEAGYVGSLSIIDTNSPVKINKSSHNNTIESFCECGLPMTTFRGEPVCSGILSTCSKNK